MLDSNQGIVERLGILRPMPNPFGMYFRLRSKDRASILEVLAQGTKNFSGIVCGPLLARNDKEVRDAIRKISLDVVLDPQTQQLAYEGSFTRGLGSLPWGSRKPQTWEDYSGSNGRRRMAALAKFAIENQYTDVLSPSHVIRNAEDPWVNIDPDLVKRLRDELDKQGGKKITIIGSVALSYAAFRDQAQREEIVRLVEGLPFSQIWLKVDGLGSTATPTAVLNYVEAAQDFHHLELPVLADQIGANPGLALLSVGAVAGLSHGVTLGERFDSRAWNRPKSKSFFSPPHRVYLSGLDLLLGADEAKTFLESSSRIKALFACHDKECCERGMIDMLQKPAKHFLFQRMKEVSDLGRTPDSVRSREYVDGHLRNVTDNLIKVTNMNIQDATLAKRLLLQRKRLDGLRISLSRVLEKQKSMSTAPTLQTRKSREART